MSCGEVATVCGTRFRAWRAKRRDRRWIARQCLFVNGGNHDWNSVDGRAGAILFVAYLLAHPALDRAIVPNSPYTVIHMIGAAAMVLIIGGMLGIAQSSWPRVGRYGQIAYLLALGGSVYENEKLQQ